MKVAVVGLDYVGTVTAACLASRDHDVWGVDVDVAKVVVTNDQAVLDAIRATPPRHLIDLTGRLGREVESLPGYEGRGW